MCEKLKLFREKYGLFFIVLVAVLFFFILAFRKNCFFVDEIFSYGHANSTVGAFLLDDVDSGFEKNKGKLDEIWFDSEHLMKYLTVQEGEEFNYKNIYKNLTKDVHPPFYLMILHSVSSLFNNSFNMWIGLSINLVILVGLILSFYRLSLMCFKEKKKALVTGLFFVFMPAVVEMEIFIRMYLLQMLLMVNVVYYSLEFLENKKVDVKAGIMVFLCMTLGAYTHFYSYVYGFFLCLVLCMIFLCKKSYKKMFVYGGIMLGAVLLSFVLFEPAKEMLFNSSRGSEAIESLSLVSKESLALRLDYFLKYFFVGVVIFADKIYWLISLMLLWILWIVIFKKNDEKLDIKFVVLFLVSVLGGGVVSLTSTAGFWGVRYYLLSNVFLLIVLVECYYKYFTNNRVKKWLCKAGFLFVLIFNIWYGYSNFYLQLQTEANKFENIVKGKRVLILSDWFLFNFEMLDKLVTAKDCYKIYAHQFSKVERFLVGNDLGKGDVVIAFAGVGKIIGNKRTLEQEKYRLKYKDLVFYGRKSYEVYERY